MSSGQVSKARYKPSTNGLNQVHISNVLNGHVETSAVMGINNAIVRTKDRNPAEGIKNMSVKKVPGSYVNGLNHQINSRSSERSTVPKVLSPLDNGRVYSRQISTSPQHRQSVVQTVSHRKDKHFNSQRTSDHGFNNKEPLLPKGRCEKNHISSTQSLCNSKPLQNGEKSGIKTGGFYKQRNSLDNKDRITRCNTHTERVPVLTESRDRASESPERDDCLISAAYTQPVSPESLYCGNVVKARYNDGKLYRGEIVKVDIRKERCLIDFVQHPESWCLAEHIFPSSPVKSQIIKRLIAKAQRRVEGGLSDDEDEDDYPALEPTPAPAKPEPKPRKTFNHSAVSRVLYRSDSTENTRSSSTTSSSNSSIIGDQVRFDRKAVVAVDKLAMPIMGKKINGLEKRASTSRDSPLPLDMEVECCDDSSQSDNSSEIGYDASCDTIEEDEEVTFRSSRKQTKKSSPKKKSKPSATKLRSSGKKNPKKESTCEIRKSGRQRRSTRRSESTDDAEEDMEVEEEDVKTEKIATDSCSESDVFCELCGLGDSDAPNEIVICDRCNLGFHQECHIPAVDGSQIDDEALEWLCFSCSPAQPRRRQLQQRDEQLQVAPVRPWRWALPRALGELNYNPENLDWDEAHFVNQQGVYCYCGGAGRWFLQMIQCHACRQWYHQDCVQCLKTPLMFGDRFFAYVCSLCNAGQEFVLRLHLRWVDFVHLAVFHLSMMLGREQIRFKEDLLPFLDENAHRLQLPKEIEEYDAGQIKHKLESVLHDECCTGRFKHSKKGGVSSYSLCVRTPPTPPIINLPSTFPLSTRNTSKWAWKHSYRKFNTANQVAVSWPYTKPALPSELCIGGRAKKHNNKKTYKKKYVTKARAGGATSTQVGIAQVSALAGKKRKRDEQDGVNTADVKPPPRKKYKIKRPVARFNHCDKTVRLTSYPNARRHPHYIPNQSPTYRPVIDKTLYAENSSARRKLLQEEPVYTTLDKLIPRPLDFTGDRNPFLCEVERGERAEAIKWRHTAVRMCTRGDVLLQDTTSSITTENYTKDNKNTNKNSQGKSGTKNTQQQQAKPSTSSKGRSAKAANKLKGKETTDQEQTPVVETQGGKKLFKYEPYIVIAKRTRDVDTVEYALAWDP